MKKEKNQTLRSANQLVLVAFLTLVFGPAFFILGTRTTGLQDEVNPMIEVGFSFLLAAFMMYTITFIRWIRARRKKVT